MKVPFWWYSKLNDMFRHEEGKYETYTICMIPYTTEYGFDLDKDSSEKLGLLIVRRIVTEKLKGNLSTESSQSGTKVLFDFPLSQLIAETM